MDVTIRKTTEYDTALEIAKTLPNYFSEQGLGEIKEQLPTQSVYGAFYNDEMIGFIGYKELNKYTLRLAWLAVLEKYQGQGIGTKLVNQTLEKEKANFSVCQVNTLAETVADEGYEKTRKFYEELGFIPIEIVDPYPGWQAPGNPCQIMVKFLK